MDIEAARGKWQWRDNYAKMLMVEHAQINKLTCNIGKWYNVSKCVCACVHIVCSRPCVCNVIKTLRKHNTILIDLAVLSTSASYA